MSDNFDLVIKNIGFLATPKGISAHKGEEQGKIEYYEDVYIGVNNGKITTIGSMKELENIAFSNNTKIIDAKSSLVTPGLVDPHTHLIFSGWRQKELSLKLKGKSYLDILNQGGGILNTVRNTRKATLKELVEHGKKSLNRMISYGTTTCEAKSGYGLNTNEEIKSLEAIKKLNEVHPMDIVPTFMGAHAVPEKYKDDPDEFVRIVCEEMLPIVAKKSLAEFNDVFCEKSVLDVKQSRKILEEGKRYDLIPKVHADEITPLGGAKLAAEVGAISAEHLINADDEGLNAMAEKGTIAVILPGTSLFLGADFARARDMINMGIPVALSTDFNPGSCPTESLQLIMNLACMKYKMTPEEVLTGVTLNAAAAINRSKNLGTIENGKQADIVIWDAPDLDFICYHFGVNLVKTVIKKGKVVVKRDEKCSIKQ